MRCGSSVLRGGSGAPGAAGSVSFRSSARTCTAWTACTSRPEELFVLETAGTSWGRPSLSLWQLGASEGCGPCRILVSMETPHRRVAHFTSKVGTVCLVVLTPEVCLRAQVGVTKARKDGSKQTQIRLNYIHSDPKLSSPLFQFSKDKYLLENPPEKLRKELEEELKLSAADIRSHGWYHGHIPREVSETLVLRNGDFLVRDSLTSVGDFVLTCRWDNEVLHFKISKVLVKSNETKARALGLRPRLSSDAQVQYVLEADSFDSVQELVRFYVGQRKPVSQSNGAHIYCPVSRTLPLRYLEATFALANSKQGSAYSPSSPRGAHIKRRSVTMTDGLTAEKMIPHSDSEGPGPVRTPAAEPEPEPEPVPGCRIRVSPRLPSPKPQNLHRSRELLAERSSFSHSEFLFCSPSTIHHHKDAMRNCAMSMDQIQEYRCPLSPVGETPLSPAYSAISRQRALSGGRALAVVPPSPVMRHSSDPQLSPSAASNPPAHPAHPSHSARSSPAHHLGFQPRSSDPAGSYCDLRPCPAGPPKPPTKSYVERLRVEEGRRGGREDGEGTFSAPQVETTSSFRPSRFESPLLPAENKPLEMSVLKRVKELLAEVDARTAAKHITMVDCTVARILGVTSEIQRTMGVASGLELLTLPHGRQLRLDLLERFNTMSIMMAVDLLGCTGSTEERAALLHKTIQLAAELKSSLGNMFGFAAVMRALELPQISRLEQTWVTLRQRHTEGAILYEKKLKPFLKNINDGKESSVMSTTSVPNIIPILSLLEKGVAVGETPEPWESSEVGVDVVMYHLEAARTIAHHGGVYRTNAETKLQARISVVPSICSSTGPTSVCSLHHRVTGGSDLFSDPACSSEQKSVRSSRPSSRCACCGAAAAPRAANRSATRSSTRSSPPCRTSWSLPRVTASYSSRSSGTREDDKSKTLTDSGGEGRGAEQEEGLNRKRG
ncbi:SH2 domain-containing protein 3C [Takifugu flavidus]|uniref:SH2 domain-containing protein 3C n=1 Tax=Takifugu flavidus TaxID=433684 RepID=A0A5C6NLD4_9TELE|nr:SH2 domain-containing protein 3C [Takifugu flavidus]